MTLPDVRNGRRTRGARFAPHRAGPRTLGESAWYARCLFDPTWGTVDPNLTTLHDGARDARGDAFVCAATGAPQPRSSVGILAFVSLAVPLRALAQLLPRPRTTRQSRRGPPQAP
jgi:hypothetical protein